MATATIVPAFAVTNASNTFSSITVTGAATVGTTLGVTGATTLAALSATTGSFSSTLAVTGASTLAAVSATTGTFSSTIAASNFTMDGVLASTKTNELSTSKPTCRIYDDMLFTTIPNYFYAGGTSGTNTANPGVTPCTGAGNGYIQHSTTGGAANGAVIETGVETYLGLYSSFRGRVGFWLPNLSTTAEQYTIYVGAWSTAGTTPSRQCIYLTYTDDGGGTGNNGKFVVVTNNGGTSTSTTVSAAANTYYVFDWSCTVTSPGSTNTATWKLYAAGVQVATGSGTVYCPTSSDGTECSALAVGIKKNAGTTARLLMTDFWEFIGAYS